MVQRFNRSTSIVLLYHNALAGILALYVAPCKRILAWRAVHSPDVLLISEFFFLFFFISLLSFFFGLSLFLFLVLVLVFFFTGEGEKYFNVFGGYVS